MQQQCPNCRNVLEVPENYAGQQMQCPYCQQIFVAAGSQPPTVPAPLRQAPMVQPQFQLSPMGGNFVPPPPMGNMTPTNNKPIVFGILAIVFALCCTCVGIVLSIIGLVESLKQKHTAGTILCVIALILNIISLSVGAIIGLNGGFDSFVESFKEGYEQGYNSTTGGY